MFSLHCDHHSSKCFSFTKACSPRLSKQWISVHSLLEKLSTGKIAWSASVTVMRTLSHPVPCTHSAPQRPLTRWESKRKIYKYTCEIMNSSNTRHVCHFFDHYYVCHYTAHKVSLLWVYLNKRTCARHCLLWRHGARLSNSLSWNFTLNVYLDMHCSIQSDVVPKLFKLLWRKLFKKRKKS